MRLTFCLCHMVYKTTRKEYGILQTRHTDVCLDKADGVCRREVGTARLPAVTLPCLDCLTIHIHTYLYCYPYYFISILLHYHIDVLLYCFISTLSYICIALFISIWIYRNINISILVLFPFASSLHARRCCVWRNMAKLPRSKASLHSRAAREIGRTFFRGVANNTPYYGCCTLSGLPSESKARSFSQKLNVARASLRE